MAKNAFEIRMSIKVTKTFQIKFKMEHYGELEKFKISVMNAF